MKKLVLITLLAAASLPSNSNADTGISQMCNGKVTVNDEGSEVDRPIYYTITSTSKELGHCSGRAGCVFNGEKKNLSRDEICNLVN